MIGFGRIHTWFAVTISAALIGAAGSVAYDGSTVLASRASAPNLPHIVVQTQAEDQPDVEQVGEGDATDQETLDEGAPPAQDGEDVELLDQGAPPATTSAPPADTTALAPVTAAAPPADVATTTPVDSGTVYTAPTAQTATGPALPPGFGTGRVHVSAGRFGFPVGLENCHVGAVTGRAYVGLDCGEGGDRVGHAPSFEDFPFVLEAEFPFESDDAFFSDPFFTGGESADTGEDDVEVSTGRSSRNNGNDNSDSDNDSSGNANDSNTAENVVVTGIGTGNSAAELAQKSRDRGPRVRAGKDRSGQAANRQNAGDDNASAASAHRGSKSNGQAKNQGKSKKQQAGKADKSNKGKKSKDGKKKRGKRRSGKNG
jgi:hypothetical protein